jgi:hypothetical protein
MMAQISLVGLRMFFAFSRFLILIMHFVRTNYCSHYEYEGVAKKMREYVSNLEKWHISDYFAKNGH